MNKVSRINSENVLLCSDLHLNSENFDITKTFCNWLKKNCCECSPVERPEWVLVLGDFFEHWIGDDLLLAKINYDYKDIVESIRDCFSQLRKFEVSIGIMHGNRDFLIGEKLLNYLHSYQLDSSVVLISKSIGKILLLHGDELCTHDTEHQIFRKLVNSREWQSKFISNPIEKRQEIANSIRKKSEFGKKEKSKHMMDIDPHTAEKFLKKNNSKFLIHGHTHLPGRSFLPSGKERWVIPNWTVDNHGRVCGGGIQIKKKEIKQILI